MSKNLKDYKSIIIDSLGSATLQIKENIETINKKKYKIKVGMAGSVYPEDWEYREFLNFKSFEKYIKDNSSYKTFIYFDKNEDIIVLEYSE